MHICQRAVVQAFRKARDTRTLFHVSEPLLYPRIRPSIHRIVDSSLKTTNTPADDVAPLRLTSVKKGTSETLSWFEEYNRRFNDEFPPEKRTEVQLPPIPENSDSFLQPLIEFLIRDLSLTDMSLLDLRQRDTPWGDNIIMLICTARSERQLRTSAERLKGFLRPHGMRPQVEGLVNWENTKVKRRRRRKMIGRANYQVEDDSLTWLFCNIGGNTGIILQLFTEQGRSEYRLEELWAEKANNTVAIPETAHENRSFTPILSSKSAEGKGPLSRRLYSTWNRPRNDEGNSSRHQSTMSVQPQALVSLSLTPAINLAYENFLFKSSTLPTLFLYRNNACVVIGRNQNPWLECNIDFLELHGIQLIRRYSGGGAVYHDPGNTNYSMITARAEFSRTATAKRIVSALKTTGIDLRLNERHDITFCPNEGSEPVWLKCSGSAFKIAKERAYAHGTMLLTSDLKKLGQALRPKHPRLMDGHGIIHANGVTSVPSKVGALGIAHEDFCDYVTREFRELGAVKYVTEKEMINDETRGSIEELQSLRWTFGQTPVFKQSVSSLGSFKNQNVIATVRNGEYRSFEASSPQPEDREKEALAGRGWRSKGTDAGSEVIELLRDTLLATPFSVHGISNVLLQAQQDGIIID